MTEEELDAVTDAIRELDRYAGPKEHARAAIEALDKHRAEIEYGPDETPEQRAGRIARDTSGGIDRTTSRIWRTTSAVGDIDPTL